MSGDDLKLARRAFAALDEGVDAVLEFVHPEFEGSVPPELSAEPDTYLGHEGIRRYFESFYEAVDEVSFAPESFEEVGDRIVIPFAVRVRGRTTGLEAEQRAVMVWELRDGKVFRIESFVDRRQALAAIAARATEG